MRPDITSAITDAEAIVLARLAHGRDVLELGSGRGFSTVIMARTARSVHTVDWHQGDGHARERETLFVLWDNLVKYEVLRRVVIHVGRSEEVLPFLRLASFDMAFHDAYHTTEAVANDAALIRPLLRPGGFFAFHDYGRFGVKAAVDALGPRQSLTGSLAVVAA